MSYWPGHERRALMRRLEPGLVATAERHRAPLQEWTTDLGAGRAVVIPIGPPRPCSWCWQQRRIWHAAQEGLVALPCDRCFGSGWEPS